MAEHEGTDLPRHLRAVRTIAEEGSVTRAATRLGLTQPALSAQLRTVERLVGGQLFDQIEAIAGVTVAALGSLVLILILSLYMVVDRDRITGGGGRDLMIGGRGADRIRGDTGRRQRNADAAERRAAGLGHHQPGPLHHAALIAAGYLWALAPIKYLVPMLIQGVTVG